jgi:transcriptional regulator with XRE-family HTH domain
MPEAPIVDVPVDDLLEAEINRTIAVRLREARRRQGLTIQDVAESSGLSLGMVSKVENAQTSPSLRTLAKLGQALEIPLASLLRGFEVEGAASVVKAGRGIEVVRPGTRHGYRYELLAPPINGPHRMEPYLVTLDDASEPFPFLEHDGSEFVYVLAGRLRFRYGQRTHDLEAGDAVFLDGVVPHGPETLEERPVRLLSIMLSSEALGT